MRSISEMLPILRCPAQGDKLTISGDCLITASGRSYPIINGKPILVCNVSAMHITPPPRRIVSENIPEFKPASKLDHITGIIINLGSGNVLCRDPRVISVDVLPNTNVDIVAEAEALPFCDNSIDHIVSGAVFEHIPDPMRAIKEVRRVLKPGGTLHIDTAFMQGYHGFPGHFFNMTPQAIETYLADDFQLLASSTSSPHAVFYPIVCAMNTVLECLPEVDRERFKALPLGEALQEMSTQTPAVWKGRVTESVRRSLCANFAVTARKPERYEERSENIITQIGADKWSAIKRDYYTARMELIRAENGIHYAKLRAIDDFGAPVDEVLATQPDLASHLKSGTVSDTLSPDDWVRATAFLKASVQLFEEYRDAWMVVFMARQRRTEINEKSGAPTLVHT